MFLFGTVVYKLADTALMVVINLPLAIFCLVLAFVKVNGVPFHFFLLNVLQTMKRSPIRVWNKNLSDAEIIALSQVELPPRRRPRSTRKPRPAPGSTSWPSWSIPAAFTIPTRNKDLWPTRRSCNRGRWPDPSRELRRSNTSTSPRFATTS